MEKKVEKHWDKTFASVYWKLYWKEGKEFTLSPGKVYGEPEARDKNYMLFRCLQMLVGTNYIWQKTHKIEVFKRWGPIMRPDTDPIVLVLYPTMYEIKRSDLMNNFIKEFLDHVYLCVNTGVAFDPKKFKPVRKEKNIGKDLIFSSVYNTTFRTYDEFFTQQQYLKSIGIAEGALIAFDKKVRFNQPELFRYELAVGAQKEAPKKLVPANDFYGAVHNKINLEKAAKNVQEKFNLKDLPPGETLKSLLQKELQKINQNINQQNQQP